MEALVWAEERTGEEENMALQSQITSREGKGCRQR